MKSLVVLLLAVLACAGQGMAESTLDVASTPAAPQQSELLDESALSEESEDAAFADEEDTEEGEESDEEAMNEAAVSLAEVDASTEGSEEAPRKGKAGPRRKPALIAPQPRAPQAPWKFHSERITAQTSSSEDPEVAKLNLALAAVKEDILSTNKQITDERKWVIAVAKIIASYNDKMKRVEGHIVALRKEMKNLYRKKKQIENLKLQKALEGKLKEARDELATLTNSLKHVQSKQGELNKSGADLRATIAGIQGQLAKLRGQQLRKPKPAPRKCKKGMRFSRKQKKCVKRRPKNGKKAKKAKKGKKF